MTAEVEEEQQPVQAHHVFGKVREKALEQAQRIDKRQGVLGNIQEGEFLNKVHGVRSQTIDAVIAQIDQGQLQRAGDAAAEEGVLLEAGGIDAAQSDQDHENPEGPLDILKPG